MKEQKRVWCIFRFLQHEERSSNFFGAYASKELAEQKAKSFNERFDDEFEYKVINIPVLEE